MDKETIIRMAGEAYATATIPAFMPMTTEALEKFAKLVAEHEREACAKYFEDHWRQEWTDEQIAAAIRARGQ